MQCGMERTDIVGNFFYEIRKGKDMSVNIVIRDCMKSNDRLSMLILDNKMIACVIERRTEFNDLEFTLIQL